MRYTGGDGAKPLTAAAAPPAKTMPADRPMPARLIWRDLVSASGSASAVVSVHRYHHTVSAETRPPATPPPQGATVVHITVPATLTC
jgi:hypothetical protein